MASFKPMSGMGFMPSLSPYGGTNFTQTPIGGSLLNAPPRFDSFASNAGNPYAGGFGASGGFEGIFGLVQSILQFVSSMMIPGGEDSQDPLPQETNGQESAYPPSEKPLPESRDYSSVPEDNPAPPAPSKYKKPGGKPEPEGKPEKGEKPETPYGGQQPAGKMRKAPVQGGGPNETVLKNNGKDPMKVAFMKNPTPENPDSKPEIVEIQPGETLQAGLPEGWKGRIYKVNDSGAQEATLGEVNFEPGKTWYDVSAIDGFNGGMTIEPTGGAGRGTGNDRVAGSSKDLREGAPPELLKDGGDVLASTDPVGDYGSNQGAVDYLRKNYGGTGDVYTNPIDDRENDSPMRDTTDTSLTINLY